VPIPWPASATFQRGAVFAGCTVDALLGIGGVGEVYEVVTVAGARRALKVLQTTAQVVSQVQDRFAQECSILASIDHVNVVRFFGAGVEQGRVWLLIELVDGTDLEQLRRSAGGTLGVERAVRLVRQACDGVAAAHRKDVIHRHLSPSNILATRTEIAKVIDFGSAKISSFGLRTDDPGAAFTGLYLAPEVILGRPTFASDVFSAALTLYVSITGAHPAGAGPMTLVEAATRQLNREIPPLASVVPGVPGNLSLLLQRALSLDPDRRPCMDELREGLGAVLDDLQAPRRRSARNLDLQIGDWRLARTLPAMAVFPAPPGEAGRAAVLPPQVAVVAGASAVTSPPPTHHSSLVDALPSSPSRLGAPSTMSTPREHAAAPPPESPVASRAPVVSTLRSAVALARTMPMQAMEAPAVDAPAERGSTGVPVERSASLVAAGKRRGPGAAIAAAGVVVVGALAAAAWVVVGRFGGGGGEVAGGAGSAVAPAGSVTAPPPPVAPPTVKPADLPAMPPTATASASRPKPPAPPRRGTGKPKPPF
jgi:serine/threonine protein kinase